MDAVYMPHGNCYLWQTPLVGLHVSSDLTIAIAYYSIPITLFILVRQRRDLPFAWLFLLFSAFILSCGTTHILEIWTLWHPDYWLSGGLKALTAGVSITTAFVLIPVIPKALVLPTPAQLEAANAELRQANANLQAEILARQTTQAALELSQSDLRRTLAFERQVYTLTEHLRDLDDEHLIWQAVVAALCQSLPVVTNAAYWTCETAVTAQALSEVQRQFIQTTPIANVAGKQSVLTHPLGEAAFATALPIDLGELAAVLWCFHTALLTPSEQRTVQQMMLQGLLAVRQTRLAAAMQKQLAEAERLNYLKDDFVSTVSHELRTPMTSMKLALAMLQGLKPNLDSRQLRYWQILEAQCDQEIALINDLLDFQAFTATDLGEVSTLELSQWLAEHLATAPLHENDLCLTTRLTPAQITTHAPTLRRIIQELLTNACKYTPRGGEIAVETQGVGSKIAIAIKNSGAFISPEEQTKVFDPFYRSQRDHGKRGTGLGLALIKRQVERLGGQISLNSDTEWTTFTVHLPAVYVPQPETAPQTESPPAGQL